MVSRKDYPVEYVAWANMKQRCLRTTHKSYHRYGGRGIKVCKRWLSFANFIADMGPKPSPELTLERKRNDDGYSASNCVWASRREQQNNMEKTRRLTICGVERTLTEWRMIADLPRGLIEGRIKRGWPSDRLLDPPMAMVHTFRGQTKSLDEWCREVGILPGRVRGRLHRGWTFEQALTTPLDRKHRGYTIRNG